MLSLLSSRFLSGSLAALCGLWTTLPLRAELVLVDHGKAHAAIVLPATPSPSEELAARELVEHIRLATGATLETLSPQEGETWEGPRLFLGPGAAAAKAGLEVKGWQADEYRILSNERDLFIVGKEGPYADIEPPCGGTLYGVYEFLEEALDIRWLWPGELGRYVPERQRLAIAKSHDASRKPKLSPRIWWHQDLNLKQWNEKKAIPPMAWDVPGLGFSVENTQRYYRDLLLYFRRHRIGESGRPPLVAPPGVNHTFMGWWAKYGAKHPEWFMMNEDGTRGPRRSVDAGPAEAANTDEAAMCVSNPELHRFIVNEWWDGGDFLSLGEVDLRVFCHCPKCLEWDGKYQPGPAFAKEDFEPLTSLRYAKFWKAVRELAVQRNPKVKVGSFLYWNYFPAPQEPIDLSGGFHGEFTPWSDATSFYPMTKEADQWLREQWLGWRKTGIELIYRPNFTHAGHVMPHISTRQAGEFFRFAAQNGMKGFFFDSLFGHWATQGPMIYVLMELMWNPEREIDAIRRDYFAAFGPAAKSVEAYFDYWEAYATRWPRESKQYNGRSLFLPHTFLQISYEPEIFPPAFKLLKTAREEAAKSHRKDYAERVAFLQAGLEHAQLVARLYQSLEGNKPPTDPGALAEARAALYALAEFRKKHEHLYLADFNLAAQREGWTIKYQPLLISEE